MEINFLNTISGLWFIILVVLDLKYLSSIVRYEPPYREPCQIYWNLKRANWIYYKILTDEFMTPIFFSKSEMYLKTYYPFYTVCIPRGQQKKHTPFWDDYLQELKEDKTYEKVHNIGLSESCITLCKTQSILKRSIIETKHFSSKIFLKNLTLGEME